jgi:hypothetical protein
MPRNTRSPQTPAEIRAALKQGWRPVKRHVRVMDGRDRNQTGVMIAHNMGTGKARVKFGLSGRPVEMPAHRLQDRSLLDRLTGRDKRW